MTWKLILCGFEHCVLLNFKASAAEIGIFHGLKIVFSESTVHRLSVDSFLVYQKTVHEDIKQFISSAQLKKTGVKVNIMRLPTLRSIKFQGICSRNWNFSRSENCIFRIYGPLAFCRWLARVSKDSPWRSKVVYSRCIIEKDVKVNIMRFRTWCWIDFQGPCSRDLNLGQPGKSISEIYDP
jgi:hypothetical protein